MNLGLLKSFLARMNAPLSLHTQLTLEDYFEKVPPSRILALLSLLEEAKVRSELSAKYESAPSHTMSNSSWLERFSREFGEESGG